MFGLFKSLKKKREIKEEKERLVRDNEIFQIRRRDVQFRISRYPIKEMTEQEFANFPRGDSVTREFLEKCPLNTWFICRKNEFVPDVVILGQVVKGDDLFCDQWGAGLAVPERGINRYVLKLVKTS